MSTRDEVISALLDRIRALCVTENIQVVRNYTDSLEVESAIYVGDVTGDIELHGAAAQPYQWRDAFTVPLAVQITDPDSDPDVLAARCGHIIDLVVFAVSSAWDNNDPRTALVEPGTDGPITVDGPSPVHYTPKSRWLAIALIDVPFARHLYPTDQEISP